MIKNRIIPIDPTESINFDVTKESEFSQLYRNELY